MHVTLRDENAPTAPAASARLRNVVREKELWLLAALVLLFFHRPLTTGTFFFRDLYQTGFQKRDFLVRSVFSGELPLWDPLIHGGQPFLGSPANAVFYPASLAFLLLPTVFAFNLVIVAHFLFAAVAAYCLARVAGLSPRAAFVAGAVYGLAGVMLSTGNLLVYLFAAGWLPVVLALLHRHLQTRRAELALLASIAAALPLLAGGVEFTAMMFVTLLVWVLAVNAPGIDRPRRAGVVIAIGIGAVALSLVQTLPATEMIANSSRAGRVSYASFTQWSVSPRRLPELVVPQFFGRTDALDDADYWGLPVEDRGFPYLASIYCGALTLILAIAGVVSRSQPRAFDGGGAPEPDLPDAAPRAFPMPARALGGIALAGIVLSLGRFLPIFPLIYRLPLVATFRYPVKAMMITTLPLALLAGLGIDRCASARTRRGVAMASAAAALLLAWLGSMIRANGGFAASLEQAFFLQRLAGDRSAALACGFFEAALFLALAAIAVVLFRARSGVAVTVLAALVAADLAVAGMHVNAYAPRSLFEEPAAARLVRRFAGDGRLYRTADPIALSLRAPSNDIWWLARWKLETLSGYNAATFGIPTIFHVDYDGLAPVAIARMTSIVDSLPWSARLPILRAAGVRIIMTFDDLHVPGVRLLIRSQSGAGMLSLYALDDSPRERFVGSAELVPSSSAAIARMTSGFSDDTILLRGGPAPAREGCGTTAVRATSRRLNAVRYEVNAPCDGWVYFAESWYPGWRVTVDGHEQPLLRANDTFSAVAVPRGPHAIERRYVPLRLIAGAAASTIALTAMVIAIVILGRRRSSSR